MGKANRRQKCSKTTASHYSSHYISLFGPLLIPRMLLILLIWAVSSAG